MPPQLILIFSCFFLIVVAVGFHFGFIRVPITQNTNELAEKTRPFEAKLFVWLYKLIAVIVLVAFLLGLFVDIQSVFGASLSDHFAPENTSVTHFEKMPEGYQLKLGVPLFYKARCKLPGSNEFVDYHDGIILSEPGVVQVYFVASFGECESRVIDIPVDDNTFEGSVFVARPNALQGSVVSEAALVGTETSSPHQSSPSSGSTPVPMASDPSGAQPNEESQISSSQPPHEVSSSSSAGSDSSVSLGIPPINQASNPPPLGPDYDPPTEEIPIASNPTDASVSDGPPPDTSEEISSSSEPVSNTSSESLPTDSSVSFQQNEEDPNIVEDPLPELGVPLLDDSFVDDPRLTYEVITEYRRQEREKTVEEFESLEANLEDAELVRQETRTEISDWSDWQDDEILIEDGREIETTVVELQPVEKIFLARYYSETENKFSPFKLNSTYKVECGWFPTSEVTFLGNVYGRGGRDDCYTIPGYHYYFFELDIGDNKGGDVQFITDTKTQYRYRMVTNVNIYHYIRTLYGDWIELDWSTEEIENSDVIELIETRVNYIYTLKEEL